MEEKTSEYKTDSANFFRILNSRKHKVPPYDLIWTMNDDIDIIRERICSELKDKDLDIKELLNDIADDGSFKSIDYLSEDKKTWHPIKHLENLKKIQIAINSEGNPFFNSEDAKKKVLKCINYWVEKNYNCPWSGWYNTIGIGLYIPDILIFGIEGFEDKNKKKLLENFKPTLIQNETVKWRVMEREVDATAANLFDEVMASMKVAVIENDGNTLMWLKRVVENELRVFPPHKFPMHRYDSEGIREDMSFQQHFQLVYFGGYGDVFLNGAARYLKYTENTQYAVKDSCIDLLADFILDGIQFPMRNGYRDFNSAGRGCSRKNGSTGIKTSLKKAVDSILLYKSVKRHDELISLIENRYESPVDKGAGGHRYFYESDYQVMNNENYMAAVRHASKNTRIFEFLNDENALGYYMGLGGIYYYVYGDEYVDTPPVYDWNQIPGTTTRQGFIPEKTWVKSYNQVGNTNLTGGISNGRTGCSYFYLNHEGVSAKKAYFMFEDAVICLGAGIKCSKNEEIATNINQVNLNGSVYAGKKKLALNEEINECCPYVYHNKTIYITDSKVKVSAKTVNGDWAKVYLKLKDDKFTSDIFNISISHGVKPSSGSYSYTVLMNKKADYAEKYIENPCYEVLENSVGVQAVRNKNSGTVMAVFHKAGSIKTDDTEIKVNKGCILIYENSGDKKILTAASENHKEKTVKITANGKTLEMNVSKSPCTAEF